LLKAIKVKCRLVVVAFENALELAELKVAPVAEKLGAILMGTGNS
jgi:hypothetical protein